MAKKDECVAMYVDSMSWASDVKAVTSDSITANAGAVDCCIDAVRFGGIPGVVSRQHALSTHLAGHAHPTDTVPSHTAIPSVPPMPPYDP
jgi:hypothetical protein